MIVRRFFKFIFIIGFLFISGCNRQDDDAVYLTDSQSQRILMFSSIPWDYRNLTKAKGGKCNIERIKTTESGDWIIEGWVIPSDNAKKLAHTLLLGLNVNGKESFGIPRRKYRADVAEYFHNNNLLISGFEAQFKKRSLPENACIEIYQIIDQELIQCPNNLLVNFKAEQICS